MIRVRKKSKKAWKTALLCFFWTIWRERNRRTFEKLEQVDQTLKQSFMYIFFLVWVIVYRGYRALSMMDFVEWLSSI